MAHYAFLDSNNIVTEVIVGKNESEDGIDWEQYYGEIRNQQCKRTSYNTYAGVNNIGTAFRKNYAGIGYTYDTRLDAFIPPVPPPLPNNDAWQLNEETCIWFDPKALERITTIRVARV